MIIRNHFNKWILFRWIKVSYFSVIAEYVCTNECLYSQQTALRSNIDGPSNLLNVPKYSGNKTSRSSIFNNDQSQSDEEDDNESDIDESFLTARNGDESKDLTKDFNDFDHYEETQPFGEVLSSNDEDDDSGQNDEMVDDDNELEESDEDDVSDPIGDDDEIVHDNEGNRDEEFNGQIINKNKGSNLNSDLHESIKSTLKSDKERGLAVRSQLQSYDKLLEIRIGVQKALIETNNLCSNEDLDFIVSTELIKYVLNKFIINI